MTIVMTTVQFAEPVECGFVEDGIHPMAIHNNHKSAAVYVGKHE
jgi:hypothetical protein